MTTKAYTSVSVFQWDGSGLVAQGEFRPLALGVKKSSGAAFHRPIAIVPRGHGSSAALLVTAPAGSAELSVYELPAGKLLFRTKLVDGYSHMRIVGLAVAPGGSALAVCDVEAGALHMLPWPLAGMTLPL